MVTRKLEVPNANLILDPAYAASEATRHFGPQLDVLREMVDYSSALLMRATPATKNSVADWGVVSTLFRQNGAALGAFALCLENGAVDAAPIHARLTSATIRRARAGERRSMYRG